MRILLHVGTHKSGTTSIQRVMADASAALAVRGIVYPRSGRPDTRDESALGHHLLAWSITGKSDNATEACWDELDGELQELRPVTAVLSSEDFEGCSAEQVQRVADRLARYDVGIIVYLRNPLEFMVSAYKQNVKSRRVRYALTFRQFVTEHADRCDYASLIERWSAAFGNEAIDFRLYDKARRGLGLIHDFFGLIGASDLAIERNGSVSNVHANVSLSDDAARVLRLMNGIESFAPRAMVAAPGYHSVQRMIIRGGPWARRCSAVVARTMTSRLISEADIQYLRERTRPFEERMRARLTDPDDAQFLSF